MEATISEVRAPSTASEVVSTVKARTERIAILRKRVDDLRQQTRRRFQQGASGLQTASFLSQLMDEFVVGVFEEALAAAAPSIAEKLRNQTALLAVGGTGRGDVCPYSDVDLLFLHTPEVSSLFEPIASQVQRDLWDAGLRLGAS